MSHTTRKQSSSALRKRRQQLLHQLPPLDRLLRGSLIERYKPCGKAGCKCARGPGHGCIAGGRAGSAAGIPERRGRVAGLPQRGPVPRRDLAGRLRADADRGRSDC